MIHPMKKKDILKNQIKKLNINNIKATEKKRQHRIPIFLYSRAFSI